VSRFFLAHGLFCTLNLLPLFLAAQLRSGYMGTAPKQNFTHLLAAASDQGMKA
jgi:hypothetical protein